MSKTNFKCMYLIDDILYKDMISKKKNSEHNSSSAPLNQYQDPSISKDYFVRGNVENLKHDNVTEDSNMKSKQIEEKDIPYATFYETLPPTNSSNDMKEECECMDSQGIYKGIDKSTGMDWQSQIGELSRKGEKRKSDENVQQQEIASKSEQSQMDIDNQSMSEATKKRKHTEEIYNNVNSHLIPNNGEKKPRENRRKRKYSRHGEITSESDDEKEWEELRKRYYKLRYDYSDDEASTKKMKKDDDILFKSMPKQVRPRRKQRPGTSHTRERKGNEKKENKDRQKPSITNNDIISFNCTLCDSQFKKFASLSRHMKNIHGEYFEEWNRQNKRKNEDEFRPNKRFKGRDNMKRKATSDIRSDIKKSKKEFACMFCQRYFKSSAGLKRHTEKQHGADNNREKRKNSDINEERYLKRQKTKIKVPVTYQNYF